MNVSAEGVSKKLRVYCIKQHMTSSFSYSREWHLFPADTHEIDPYKWIHVRQSWAFYSIHAKKHFQLRLWNGPTQCACGLHDLQKLFEKCHHSYMYSHFIMLIVFYFTNNRIKFGSKKGVCIELQRAHQQFKLKNEARQTKNNSRLLWQWIAVKLPLSRKDKLMNMITVVQVRKTAHISQVTQALVGITVR